MRLDGRETLFVTGMDEHGLKVQQAATRECVTPQDFVDRIAAEFEAMGETLNARADDIVRTTQSRNDRASQASGAHGRERRHLSVEIFRLVLGARRGLFRRKRTLGRPRRQEARAERRPGRVGGGGKLFLLPPLCLRRQAARALRGPSGIRHAGKISQRDRRLREARPLRSFDQPRHLQLGRAGPGRSEAW